MPWPRWLSFGRQQSDEAATEERPTGPPPIKPVQWENTLNSIDWSHYTSAQTITIVAITSVTTLVLSRLYRRHVRRVPTVGHIPSDLLRQRSLYGYVTRVGDADNFHLFHTPGGRFLGWGWFPGRRMQDFTGKELKDKTIHVRIAGVDAPELAHFGRPAQPFAQEAMDWLKSFVLQRYVRVYPYRKDQYERVVCSVVRRRWLFFRSDVGLNMIRRGLATVYEAKFGSEFGDREQEYRDAEAKAKSKNMGMWQKSGVMSRVFGSGTTTVETPRQYKSRVAQEEKNAKAVDMAK